MRGAFIVDVRRFADKDGANRGFCRLLASSYGLQALLAYRLGRWLLRARDKYYFWPLLPVGWPLYYLLSRYVHLVFDIRLELSADIGPGLYIGHFGAIRVRRCRIGTNCSIGRVTDITPSSDGSGPVIGDSVWLGAHVQIVGSYRIGRDATVAAGAAVRHDVPGAALCLGNPARVVMRNYDNRSFL
jgi:serine O-acetyltransferase